MADKAKTTKPPETRKDGVAMEAGLPANHRLRAEALVANGKTEDPGGIISKALIADTKERIKALKEANENGSFDARSDDKGPEPEGVTTGRIGFARDGARALEA